MTIRFRLAGILTALLVFAGVGNGRVAAQQPPASAALVATPDTVVAGAATPISLTKSAADASTALSNVTVVTVGGEVADIVRKSDTELIVKTPALNVEGAVTVKAIATPAGQSQQEIGHTTVRFTRSAPGSTTRATDASYTPWVYAALLLVFPMVLMGFDIFKAYQGMGDARDKLANVFTRGSISDEQARILAAELVTPPPGIPGLTRGLIALMLLLIIGVAVFQILVNVPLTNGDLPDSVDRILTLLAGALTSITGFYFGAKASTDATTAASSGTTSPTGSSGGPTGGSSVDPPRAKRGELLTIGGAAFGTTRGKVTVGSHQVADTDVVGWTDTTIKIKVPPDARPGPSPIIITTVDGRQLALPETAFTVLEP
jgi:hypothetical protein